MADGKHLLTDVWTSVGVVVGVGLVAVTGWLPLDSIVAIAVAVNILWTGFGLVRHSMNGLMDHAMPASEVSRAGHRAARDRRLLPPAAGVVPCDADPGGGRDRFVSMHVLVPGQWSVAQGHDLLEQVETAVQDLFPGAHVHTHLEPREDPRSYEDAGGGFTIGAEG